MVKEGTKFGRFLQRLVDEGEPVTIDQLPNFPYKSHEDFIAAHSRKEISIGSNYLLCFMFRHEYLNLKDNRTKKIINPK